MVFSVIIPTRNRPIQLCEAIRSIEQQKFSEWEAIIVDDASTQDIEKIIAPFLSEKIRYFRNRQTLGPGASRNVGIRAANPATKFICLLDDDDIYYPDFLTRTYEVLSQTSADVGFSWTGIENFYPATNKRNYFFWDPPFASKEEAFEGFLVQRLVGTGYGITFKKAVFEKVGYFDESLKAVEDTDFFLRVLKYFFYAKIPDALVCVTRNSTDHLNSDSLERATALQVIYAKHKESILKNKVAWYNFKAKISSMYYRMGDHKTGRQILRSALQERFSFRLFTLWLKLELNQNAG